VESPLTRRLPAALALLLLGPPCLAADEPTMRAPFTLTLHVDRERYYEENIGEMPYVYKGGVYLMKGDNFGVALKIRDGKVEGVSYQPELGKADVTFEFKQVVESDGSAMMMLTIRNRTSHALKMRALMTVPGERQALETSIIPIQAGLTNFESWPHAIVKLLLHEIQADS
jgi:hypothetical protein